MMLRILACVGLAGMLLATGGCRKAALKKAEARPPGAAGCPAEQLDRQELSARAEADARYMAGVSHDLNDQPEQALEDYLLVVEHDPEAEGLILDLATRLIVQKKLDQAETVLTKAVQRRGAGVMLDARLAYVQLQRGKTNEALRTAEKAVRKAPAAIQPYQQLFQIHLHAGRTNEAWKVVERAARVPKPDARFLVDLAGMYLIQHRALGGTNSPVKARAESALNRAAAMQPTNFFVLDDLATLFGQVGDRKQATAALLRIQELYPDLPTIKERLVDMFLIDRDKKNAATQLEAIIRENPTNPQAYYLLGVIAFDDKRFKEAADYFRKTILLKEDFEPAYYELSVSHINLNEPKEALEVLGKARARFKDTFLAEYFTALAYMRQKDYTNAVKYLTSAEVMARAGETNRLTHIFYFQLGSACERAGRWDEAVTHLQRCLKMEPDFPEALNYLGYMWAEKGVNLDEAKVMIEKALKAEPDNAAYLDSLAWVLYQQGKPAEALPILQKALDLNEEEDATLYDHLGDILNALGQADKAREAWERSFRIEANPAVGRKLEKRQP